jgi:predicted transglutaminase-like cysteine proteinase
MLRSSIFRTTMSTCAGLLMAWCTTPAFAHPFASEMIEGDLTDPPAGYVDLCQRDGLLCRQLAGASPATSPIATPIDARDRMSLLKHVNRYVNANVKQRADIGARDQWNRSGTGRNAVGDCEDLAIEKRLRLIEAGFPAQDLYFAIGYQRRAGLHLVLIARTEQGDYVLDSRTPYINFWAKAPYVWIMRQSTGQSDVWRSMLRASTPDSAPARHMAATEIDAAALRS